MSLQDILGQKRALGRMRFLLSTRRLPAALLFSGPQGVGKAYAAAQFAKAINCSRQSEDACDQCPSCAAADKGLDPDISLVDAAYQAGLLGEDPSKQRSIKVDTIRHLIKNLEMSSLAGRWKTAIISDAHGLVPEASNAMLKALEEPPPRTLWILITHQSERLLGTIRSRCQAIVFAPLPKGQIAAFLRDRGISDAQAAALSHMAEGSIGRALALREDPGEDPASWMNDPLSPFRLSEELPRELHKSRPLVERQIQRMAWHLRARGEGLYASAQARAALRDFADLRRALQANADPRLVLELAALGLQRLEGTDPSR